MPDQVIEIQARMDLESRKYQQAVERTRLQTLRAMRGIERGSLMISRTVGTVFSGAIGKAGSSSLHVLEGSIAGFKKWGRRAGLAAGAEFSAALIQHARQERGIAEVLSLFSKGADLTAAQRQLETNAKDLGRTYGISFSSAIQTAYDQISALGAPKTDKDWIDFLNLQQDAARLSVAGVTDFASGMANLTSILGAYNMKAIEAGSASDKLLKGVQSGKIKISDLADIGRISPLAASANVSFAELIASLADITNSGLPASEAISGMKQLLSNIVKPTDEAKEAAKKLGIEFSAAALRSKGFAGVIRDVAAAAERDPDAVANLVGSIEGLVVAQRLARDGGKGFLGILKQVENSAGTTEIAYKLMADTIAKRFEKLKGAGGALLFEQGQGARGLSAKALDFFTEKLTEIEIWLNSNEGKVQAFFDEAGKFGSGLLTDLNKEIDQAGGWPKVIEAARKNLQDLLQTLRDMLKVLTQLLVKLNELQPFSTARKIGGAVLPQGAFDFLFGGGQDADQLVRGNVARTIARTRGIPLKEARRIVRQQMIDAQEAARRAQGLPPSTPPATQSFFRSTLNRNLANTFRMFGLTPPRGLLGANAGAGLGMTPMTVGPGLAGNILRAKLRGFVQAHPALLPPVTRFSKYFNTYGRAFRERSDPRWAERAGMNLPLPAGYGTWAHDRARFNTAMRRAAMNAEAPHPYDRVLAMAGRIGRSFRPAGRRGIPGGVARGAGKSFLADYLGLGDDAESRVRRFAGQLGRMREFTRSVVNRNSSTVYNNQNSSRNVQQANTFNVQWGQNFGGPDYTRSYEEMMQLLTDRTLAALG